MKTTLIAAATTACLAGASFAAPITDTFTSFYSFGDSLTDDGKFGVLQPPSFGGRFTNGLTWAEQIEDEFIAAGKETDNYALGGATAGGGDLTAAAGVFRFSTFQGQIEIFKEAIASGENPGDRPLISIWLGANDLFASFAPADVSAAAASVVSGLTQVADATAATVDQFVVNTLPDLGATPAYGSLLALGGATPAEIADASAAATAATNQFNAELIAGLGQLQLSGPRVLVFDADAAFQDVIANPNAFGLLDVTTPCTVSLGSQTPNPFTCTADEAEVLLFNDGVHPNSVAHTIFAERITAAIAVAPVPLPASAALMLLGLAGLGAAKRRKA